MKPLNKINLIVGFDQREAIAYHVFCQSIIDRATLPVQFLPLAEIWDRFHQHAKLESGL